MDKKLAVYLCRGCDIGGALDMDALKDVATDEYKSSGIRAYNVATGQWDYTMFDNLQMKGLEVWSGTFENGVGTFSAVRTVPSVAERARTMTSVRADTASS